MIRSNLVILGALFCLQSCAEPEVGHPEEEIGHSQTPLAPRTIAQVQGDERTILENAYTQAIKDGSRDWAQEVNRGLGYAVSGEEGDLSIENTRLMVTQATLRLELSAKIPTPTKHVVVRDNVLIKSAYVEASAYTAQEAEPLLAEACHRAMAGEQVYRGELLKVGVYGPAKLMSLERNGVFQTVSHYRQKCEAFATTSEACRQPGVHPMPDCTYEDGPDISVNHALSCEYQQGHWQCEDGEGESQPITPFVADAISAALNETFLKIEPAFDRDF